MLYNYSDKDIFGKDYQCFCLTFGFALGLFWESNFRMVSFLKASLAKFFSICSMASLCCLSNPKLLPISALVWSNLVCRLKRLPCRCWFSLFVNASLFLDIKITNLLKLLRFTRVLPSRPDARLYHLGARAVNSDICPCYSVVVAIKTLSPFALPLLPNLMKQVKIQFKFREKKTQS